MRCRRGTRSGRARLADGLLDQSATVGLHGVDVADAAPERVEGDSATVPRPDGAEVASRIVDDPDRLAADRGHPIEIGVTTPVGVEYQPLPVGGHLYALDGLPTGGEWRA